MSRPQISSDVMQVVQEIHQAKTGSNAGSFEEALETVVQLASQQARDEGWYPGKYAGMALNKVLGDSQTSVAPHQQLPPSSSSVPVINPDQQAIFKQVLEEDYTITIPSAERKALNFTPGEVLQIIAYPATEQSDE